MIIDTIVKHALFIQMIFLPITEEVAKKKAFAITSILTVRLHPKAVDITDIGGKKRLSVYNTTRTKWDKKNDDYVYENKKKGRFSKQRAEDGVEYSIDLSKPKNRKKKRR